MNPFNLTDSFQVVPGTVPVVVAAPHHGSRPNVDADRGTGPIALALAARLGASAVVVHDLRRMVDVNKDPAGLSSAVRGYALRYQNELFREMPRLVIEIHGHISGQYEVEVATGFELNADQPRDALFGEKLEVLKQMLPGALATRTGRRPTVGVHPLDRDVRNTATATFTFQKIRRARNLARVECYGLHIELGQELRPSRPDSSPEFVEAVAGGLAAAIHAAFEPLPDVTVLPGGAPAAVDSSAALLSPLELRVRQAPADSRDQVLVVHPADLEALGALDGDTVLLCYGGEEMALTVMPSRTVRAGLAGVPAAVCHRLGLGKKSRVMVGRPARPGLAPAARAINAAMVVQVRRSRDREVWLRPAEMERMSLPVEAAIATQGPGTLMPVNSTVLHADPALPPCSAALSTALMNLLGLTLGEVVIIQGEP
jgi:hypothetical protein